ncbi:hypothetical protein Fmac_006575 [Flemingia macrophylla]|uniref:Uncharacterized protein n=1 Tax=Flemingia macrophylla TaxID=520843 RepID=A0ABD1NDN6_9FABA
MSDNKQPHLNGAYYGPAIPPAEPPPPPRKKLLLLPLRNLLEDSGDTHRPGWPRNPHLLAGRSASFLQVLRDGSRPDPIRVRYQQQHTWLQHGAQLHCTKPQQEAEYILRQSRGLSVLRGHQLTQDNIDGVYDIYVKLYFRIRFRLRDAISKDYKPKVK